MGDLIDLDLERWRRVPPCPECGGHGPVPPQPDWEMLTGLDTLLPAPDDEESGWTEDPELDPRVLGILDLE